MKASQLPLDFSLNVKAEGVTNLNIHVKTAENGASMLISPDKSSQSAFKVVTPKHADGKLCVIRVHETIFLWLRLFVNEIKEPFMEKTFVVDSMRQRKLQLRLSDFFSI